MQAAAMYNRRNLFSTFFAKRKTVLFIFTIDFVKNQYILAQFSYF